MHGSVALNLGQKNTILEGLSQLLNGIHWSLITVGSDEPAGVKEMKKALMGLGSSRVDTDKAFSAVINAAETALHKKGFLGIGTITRHPITHALYVIVGEKSRVEPDFFTEFLSNKANIDLFIQLANRFIAEPSSEKDKQHALVCELLRQACDVNSYAVFCIMLVAIEDDRLPRVKVDMLHYAASKGASDVIGFLAAQEVDINARNEATGQTALHIALAQEKTQAIKALINLYADPNIQDFLGQTALHLAVKNADLKIIRALLATNPKMDLQDSLGNTPAHYAAKTGQADVLQKLTAKGAKLDIANKEGKTVEAINAEMIAAHARTAVVIGRPTSSVIEKAPAAGAGAPVSEANMGCQCTIM